MSLQDNLELVRRRITSACQRCSRSPASVTLVAVTKGVPPERINEALALGVMELGENRVQEAREKQLALGYRPQASGSSMKPVAGSLHPVRWHLIGHLQRNKAKRSVGLFDVIHSVDSLELLRELERHAMRPVEVLIQVNVSGEATKFGCRPEDARILAAIAGRSDRVRLRGLMTIAPYTDDPERVRPHFRRLRHLRDDLAVALNLEPSALSLSMGMSQDFEVAIEEGADLVRIGTAIFGESPAPSQP